tara:strand:+ start:39 stop:284 length:246 start_codon:yes stop_codon:yes gene_type:complete
MIKTLMWHEVLPLGLAVYLGVVLQSFFESIVSLIMPHLEAIIPESLSKGLYSDLIRNTITLTVALCILFLVIRFVDWRKDK